MREQVRLTRAAAAAVAASLLSLRIGTEMADPSPLLENLVLGGGLLASAVFLVSWFFLDRHKYLGPRLLEGLEIDNQRAEKPSESGNYGWRIQATTTRAIPGVLEVVADAPVSDWYVNFGHGKPFIGPKPDRGVFDYRAPEIPVGTRLEFGVYALEPVRIVSIHSTTLPAAPPRSKSS